MLRAKATLLVPLVLACYPVPPARVDEALADCAALCEHRRECVDPELDLFACVDACEALANRDVELAAEVDACAVCLEELACLEAEERCAALCQALEL